MKLNEKFLGILYYLKADLRKSALDVLMSDKNLSPLKKVGLIDEISLKVRRDKMNLLNNNQNHKILYISQKVQSHSELIKFDKINLGWFRKLKNQSSTYILSRDEFYRFYVEEGREMYIFHFYKNLNPKLNNETYQDYLFDTFAIYFDENKFPDGYMPENKILNQNPENKKRFTKLLLFIELSEPEILEIKNNNKIKLGDNWEKQMDKKVLNESGVDVILVNTLWNKIIIRNGSFKVTGHIRMQPYGTNRELYKPIWIEDYEKTGYISGFKKGKLNSVN